MKFQNPVNEYVETCNYAWLWTLIFGPFYLMVKRCWVHAIIFTILSILTGGLVCFIYPFFAATIISTHYKRIGWISIPHLDEPKIPIVIIILISAFVVFTFLGLIALVPVA